MAKSSGNSKQGRQTTTNQPHKGGPVRRIVEPDKDGGYRVLAPGADRASAKTPTKAAAAKRATEIVSNLGGGEVTYKNDRGRIVDSDTVGKGNDPHPPKDKKH